MFPKKTAILVDAGFFLPRYQRLYGKRSAEDLAQELHRFCMLHLQEPGAHPPVQHPLLRIHVYDCPPLQKQVTHPFTGDHADLAATDTARFRLAFHDALRRQRNLMLRLGHLDSRHGGWQLRQDVMQALIDGERMAEDLREGDFFYSVRQKRIEMLMALDIATLSLKQQVDRIILMSSPSDFEPLADLVRAEGIEFILDPMWNDVRPELRMHVDGLRSTCPRPGTRREAPAPTPPSAQASSAAALQ